ncbi:MAG: hypothetical protein ACKVXR_03935 [Planctomycetota bacterium]
MSAKLPATAFEVYVGMGESRTYRGVAEHFEVSLRAVTKRASRDDWKRRLASLEARARRAMDARLLSAEVARRKRHFQELLGLQERSLKAIQDFPIRSATEALDVMARAIYLERTILGILRADVPTVDWRERRGRSRARSTPVPTSEVAHRE